MSVISNVDRQVGQTLALARQSAGWTREQLASAMGLSTPSLAEAEAGRRRLETAELYSAAEALKTPAQPFLRLITAGEPRALRLAVSN